MNLIPRANPVAQTTATASATLLATWRNFTEDLIFAAAWADDPRTGSITWRQRLDERRVRYNPAEEHRKCLALGAAIHSEHATATRLVVAWADPEQRVFWTGSEREAIDAGLASIVEQAFPLPSRLQRAHAANDSPVFRLRHADLLPKQP